MNIIIICTALVAFSLSENVTGKQFTILFVYTIYKSPYSINKYMSGLK